MKIGVFGSDGKSSIIKIMRHILFDCNITIDELSEEKTSEYEYLIFTNYTYQYDLDPQIFLNSLKGTLIYNNDDFYSNFFNVESKISYGLYDANIMAFNIRKSTKSTIFDLKINDKVFKDFKINLLGNINIYNVLAVIPICLIFKDIKKIKALLESMPVVENLLEHSIINNVLFVKDCSHTPNSIFESLMSIKELTKNNLIVISNIESKNTIIINPLVTYFSDFCFLINKSKKYLKKENYIFLDDEKKALKLAFKIANEGDSILYLHYEK